MRRSDRHDRRSQARAYGRSETLVVDVAIADDRSGVFDSAITLDGAPVNNGATVDLSGLSSGEHTLAVVAEDTAGTSPRRRVTFSVETTSTP